MEEYKKVSEEVFQMLESFKEEMTKGLNGNKAAARRARTKSVDLAKLLKTYRQVSVSANK